MLFYKIYKNNYKNINNISKSYYIKIKELLNKV